MRFGLLTLMSLAAPAAAGDFSLISPIDCDLAGPCYIQQYVDHDPTDAASDFSCGSLSYDGHKGTDFALPTFDMIEEGISVVAAASGTVIAVRDGMTDQRYTAAIASRIEGRECGNGVVLRHLDGWETQYCHMRQGSLSVTRGQQVKAGDFLGQVGMSGRAAFPHLHVSVRKDGRVVDPFDPDGGISCSAPDSQTLWEEPISMRPGGILGIGITGAIPDLLTIRSNAVAPATPDSKALVVYAFMFGTRPQDLLRLSLDGPQGSIVTEEFKLDRTQALSTRSVGLRRKPSRWPAGTYEGTASLLRDGMVIDRAEVAFDLP